MQNDMDVEQPHSIWLCPENAANDHFQDTIDDIAEQQQTAPFAPHVTLLGDISGAPRKTAELCRSAFAQERAVQARVKGVAMTDRFFMSLFVDLDVPPFVFDRRVNLAAALGLDVSDDFRPHLSLAYGLEEPAQTRNLTRAHPLATQRKQFFLDSVVIAASSSCYPLRLGKHCAKSILHMPRVAVSAA